jgi:hypothetical protein
VYSQKFWERLAIGLLVILAVSLGFGLVRGTVDITQVALAVIGLIGVIRGASLKDTVTKKDPTSDEDEADGR